MLIIFLGANIKMYYLSRTDIFIFILYTFIIHFYVLPYNKKSSSCIKYTALRSPCVLDLIIIFHVVLYIHHIIIIIKNDLCRMFLSSDTTCVTLFRCFIVYNILSTNKMLSDFNHFWLLGMKFNYC